MQTADIALDGTMSGYLLYFPFTLIKILLKQSSFPLQSIRTVS